MDAIIQSETLLMSAGILAELLIVASHRHFAQDVNADLGFEVVPSQKPQPGV